MVRSVVDIPAGYDGFEVVDHSKVVVAPYTRHALAVKLGEDDLSGWVRHALLRAGSKGIQARAAGGDIDGRTSIGSRCRRTTRLSH